MKRFFFTLGGLVLGVTVGSVTSGWLAAPPALACECSQPGWVYNLVSVEGPAGAEDHTPYWPSQIHLDEYEGALLISGRHLQGEDEPETLDRVGAGAE